MFEIATQFLLGILNAADNNNNNNNNNNSEMYKKNFEGYGNSSRFM